MLTAPSFPTFRTEIAGISVRQLAEEFGTPCYAYDLSIIKQRVSDLAGFDAIRFAQKALSNVAILDRMREMGVVVDAVSEGEIARAIKAGFSPQTDPPGIVYTADIFDRSTLDVIVQQNIPVNVGSPDMIDQLGERAPGREITLRINPGFGHGHSQKTNTGGPQSKHGIWHTQISECVRRAARYAMTVSGVHMHIGSGTDIDHLSQVCGAMETACKQVGASVRTISAGGGLPVPYSESQQYVDLEQYLALWSDTRERLEQEFGQPIKLEIEPGRFLTAESGYLISEIRAIKEMGDNLFYLVDAGFTDLARPILYGAYHPISICRREPENASSLAAVSTKQVIVGGPLCESGDIFTQEEGGFVASRQLPAAQIGDFLILEVAGAYGYVMASNYNSKFRCPEVLLEEGEAKLIRKRETAEDLLRGEFIP